MRLILYIPVVTMLNLYLFFLHCPLFTNEKRTLFSTLRNLENTDSFLTNILLFGSKESLNTNQNTAILNATLEFILSTKRFDEPLL